MGKSKLFHDNRTYELFFHAIDLILIKDWAENVSLLFVTFDHLMEPVIFAAFSEDVQHLFI